MDRAWAVSSLDRCPVCGSYIVYANLRCKEKVFYCGTVTQEDKIVRPCSKQGDGVPWNEPTEHSEAFSKGGDREWPTRESERARLAGEVGECCRGTDPLCAAGCLVEAALRQRLVDNEIERLRQERDVLAEVLKHVWTCEDCECASCPEGTGLVYRAYRALGGAQRAGSAS